MQVTTEKIDPCKIALTITVEPEQVAGAKEKAFQQLARNIQLPGFRRGKVPMQMARSYVDPGQVNQRAAETLIDPALGQAIEEAQIEPFAQPELELIEMNDGGPLIFKAYIPLAPVVMLGPYKGLAIERRRLTVTDADADRQIEELRTRRAEYPEITDRNVEMGDFLVSDFAVEIEGEEEDEESSSGSIIEVGKNLPDFDNALIGMTIDETREVDVVYPDDFEPPIMRGKHAHFTVTVKGIRTRQLPELTDEFVQVTHPTAKTVDELRSTLLATLNQAADEMAENDFQARLVEEIVRNTQINYPDIILRNEVAEAFNGLRERLEGENATVEQYLEAIGKTQQQLEAELANSADRRVRNSLALSQIARVENLTVEPADVDAAIVQRAERAKVSPAALRVYLEKNNGMAGLQDQVLTEKLLTYLKDVSNITERNMTGDEMQAESGTDAALELRETAEAIEASMPPPPAAPLAIQAAGRPRRSSAADEDDEPASPWIVPESAPIESENP